MFVMLFLLLLFKCDNIEISVQDFDELIVFDKIIYSNDLQNSNNIKISHPGTSIYRLLEIYPRIFKLIDTTVYFSKAEPSPIRIDCETKYLGIHSFVYKFIAYNLVVLLISSRLINLILKRHETIFKYFN